jgi:hypothetical protein
MLVHISILNHKQNFFCSQYSSPNMLVDMDPVRLITYAIQVEIECVDLITD